MPVTKEDVMELHQTIKILELKQTKIKVIAKELTKEANEIEETLQLLKNEYEQLKEKTSE